MNTNRKNTEFTMQLILSLERSISKYKHINIDYISLENLENYGSIGRRLERNIKDAPVFINLHANGFIGIEALTDIEECLPDEVKNYEILRFEISPKLSKIGLLRLLCDEKILDSLDTIASGYGLTQADDGGTIGVIKTEDAFQAAKELREEIMAISNDYQQIHLNDEPTANMGRIKEKGMNITDKEEMNISKREKMNTCSRETVQKVMQTVLDLDDILEQTMRKYKRIYLDYSCIIDMDDCKPIGFTNIGIAKFYPVFLCLWASGKVEIEMLSGDEDHLPEEVVNGEKLRFEIAPNLSREGVLEFILDQKILELLEKISKGYDLRDDEEGKRIGYYDNNESYLAARELSAIIMGVSRKYKQISEFQRCPECGACTR